MKTILAAALFLGLLTPAPVFAQTVATLGEKSIGTACTNGADAVNFDTLAQCSATSGSGTFQKAPLFVGQVTSPPYASTACDAAKAGMLQYTGGVVQYCNGSAWSTMGSSSGTGGQSVFNGWPDAIVCNVTNPDWGTAVFHATHMPSTNGTYYYGMSNGGGWYWVSFASGGTFSGLSYGGTATGFSTSNCNVSISTLVANGRAFNFVNGGANGAAAMADGTAGAPGLYFSANTNTGLYRPTTDNLAIATGGVERLRVTATGSVGIGTTTPGAPLHVLSTYGRGLFESPSGNQASVDVKSSSDSFYRLIAQSPSSGSSRFDIYDQNNAAYRLSISSSGNVGIGTTNPSALLHAYTSSSYTTSLFESNSTDSTNINIKNDQSGGAWNLHVGGTSNVIGTATGKFAIVQDGTGARMVIDQSGRVGIGTTSPSNTLQVAGNIYSVSTNAHAIHGVSTNAYGVIGESTNSYGAVFSGTYGVVASATNGNGIQANSATYYGGYFYGVNGVYGQGTSCVGWLGVGSYSAGGNCTTSFSSDERLKKDIRPVQSGLDIVMKLRPVSYLWKVDGKNHELETDKSKKAHNYGFIAQDVMKVLPDLVTETPPEMQPSSKPGEAPKKPEKSDTYYGLDYNGFIAPTIAAVQELNGKMDTLKAENDTLRAETKAKDAAFASRLEKLEARVNTLKAENDTLRAETKAKDAAFASRLEKLEARVK